MKGMDGETGMEERGLDKEVEEYCVCRDIVA
jgi:hypothetical protein